MNEHYLHYDGINFKIGKSINSNAFYVYTSGAIVPSGCEVPSGLFLFSIEDNSVLGLTYNCNDPGLTPSQCLTSGTFTFIGPENYDLEQCPNIWFKLYGSYENYITNQDPPPAIGTLQARAWNSGNPNWQQIGTIDFCDEAGSESINAIGNIDGAAIVTVTGISASGYHWAFAGTVNNQYGESPKSIIELGVNTNPNPGEPGTIFSVNVSGNYLVVEYNTECSGGPCATDYDQIISILPVSGYIHDGSTGGIVASNTSSTLGQIIFLDPVSTGGWYYFSAVERYVVLGGSGTQSCQHNIDDPSLARWWLDDLSQ